MATSDHPDGSPLRSKSPLKSLFQQTERLTPFEHLHGKKAVLIALAANLAIGTVKLIAGFFGMQSAMISEALHSFADALNSLFLLVGLQKGSKAPDKTHPFGYGLETTLWAMLASVMMLILASISMTLGFQRLFHPEPFGQYAIAAFVLLVSIVLEMMAVGVASDAVLYEKELVERDWLKKVMLAGKHVREISSPTTRFVYYEDTVALFGAIVALVAITLSEMGKVYHILPDAYVHVPDAIASIIIGLMLLGLAIYLFLHNSRGLTGSSAGPDIEEKIRNYVINLHGVSQVYDLRTIDYGLSGIVVHMRVEVDPDTQVKDVDDLRERIRDRIQARISNVKEVIIEVLADETDIEWSDQFYKLIEEGREQEVLRPREERILRNIYDFTSAVVSDIMIPRTDVDCIEVNDPLHELMDLIIETGHTRIPVYEDDVDNMLGVIHAREVLDMVRQGKMDAPIRDLVKEFDIYPETKAVSDLLEEFKRKKIQIAMVADEHGGLAGIVTIEDLLEEIVGEIWDEYDEDLAMLMQPEPTRLLISGRFEIDELNERFGVGIPDEEFKTVGGFVFGQLGREPKEGDTVEFEDLLFRVVDMDGHRVDKIEIIGQAPFVSQMDNALDPEEALPTGDEEETSADSPVEAPESV